MRRVFPTVIVLVALVAAGFVGINARRPAKAQEPVETVLVFSDRFQPDATGRTALDGGTNDDIFGVQCTGSNPQGGSAQLHAQVLTQLLATTVSIRVFNNLGKPVTGLVRLNCTVDFLLPPAPTPLAQRALAERKLRVLG